MSGETLAGEEESTYRFDALGPIVINSDGTTSRISNWTTMTESEKKTAVRLISARNKRRKEAILSGKVAPAEPEAADEHKEVRALPNAE